MPYQFMILQFVGLLFVHWVGDFVLQTDWQAKNKSHDNVALCKHVGVYTLCLLVASPFLLPGGLQPALWFALTNGALHLITDYFTSRLNSRLWAKGDVHNFFVSVGFDQLVHQYTLAATMIWFYY